MSGVITHRRFALWLSLTPQLGPRGIQTILDTNAVEGISPDRFLSLPPEVKRTKYRLAPEAAASLSRPAREIATEHEPMEERLRELSVDWVTIADATYPARLTERLERPPTVLYLYGNRGLLERETFATMASRTLTQQGAERLQRIVEQWVLRPAVLVSSHSTQAYRQSAVVPLRWGTPRILVLDCGIFTGLKDDLATEPFPTARLWRYNFDAKTDLVISACRPKDRTLGKHNRDRDWLISALADDLLFIQARQGGVMEEIGLQSLQRGRRVWATEWPEYGAETLGNLRLLEAGAKPLAE
jgi:predicted Rossmann fold nucleotide-binding protein DprA/Smf involved in DNA uptake